MALVKYNNQSIANVTETGLTSGAMTLLSTSTASSSADISITSNLDSTYPIYLFKFINIHPATDGAKFQFNMSIDSGSNYNVTKTTTFWHAFQDEAGTSTVLAYAAARDLAQSTSDQVLLWEADNDADSSVCGQLYLFSPSSTTYVKHFLSTTNGVTNSTTSGNQFVSGYGNTTSAVDAVQFKFHTGNIDAGSIKLYGIKDS